MYMIPTYKHQKNSAKKYTTDVLNQDFLELPITQSGVPLLRFPFLTNFRQLSEKQRQIFTTKNSIIRIYRFFCPK